jgi:hypothetical protein
MDVFVIPFGADRYEPYYEHAAEADLNDDEPPSSGLLARLQRRFSDVLKAAEEKQQDPAAAEPPRSFLGRVQDRLLKWMAERIVEQRLLWTLRKQTAAVVVYPSDMSFEAVLAHLHREFQRDFERHRFWLVLDTIGMVVSWPLTVIPGPNVLLFYFMFRVGGHWLSMRGARQGRQHVTWTGRPSDALVELRSAVGPDGRARHDRIQRVAESLHLRKLPAFFERMTATKTE